MGLALNDRLTSHAGLAARIILLTRPPDLSKQVCQLFCVNDQVLFLGMGARGNPTTLQGQFRLDHESIGITKGNQF